MSGLMILRPQAVTDAILTASNVPEADAPVWAVDTTYAAGALVMLLATHSIYESQAAGNLGNPPDLNPDKWVRLRATNRWRAFDRAASSSTEQGTSITYSFLPGQPVPMLAAMGLRDCVTIRLWLDDPVYGVVYDSTKTPSPLPVQADWWEFFFGDWKGGATLALFDDVPSFPNATLHLELVGRAGMAVAQILFGPPRTWGIGVTYGARVGRQVYSRREVNEYGDIELLKRPSAKRASFELVLRNNEVDAMQESMDEIDADVCLYIGSTLYESTVIFGFFQSFETLIANATESTVQLDLLGVT
jgi:hypothetical protein